MSSFNFRTFISKKIFFIPALWLLFFFIIPLIIIWTYSFSETEDIIHFKLSWTWQNYKEALDQVYLKIILKSFQLATITTLICFVLGLTVAIFISFTISERLKKIFLLLIILPFWTNMLIRTYALIAVLRGNGYINKIYHFFWNTTNWALETVGMGDEILGPFIPLEILYNNGAVVFGLVYVHLPFMILPLFGALERLDHSLIEASFDLGAGRLKTLFKVVLPKISEGIYAGILITFIPAMGSFLIPDLLGGNDSQMIANVIERQFKSANNWPFGSALSLIIMYFLFFIVAIKSILQSRQKTHLNEKK